MGKKLISYTRSQCIDPNAIVVEDFIHKKEKTTQREVNATATEKSVEIFSHTQTALASL